MPATCRPSGPGAARSRAGARAVAASAVWGMALALLLGPAHGARAAPAPAPAGLQQALDAVVEDGRATAALAELDDGGDAVWRGTSGVADLATRAQVRVDGLFRAGSVTKPFVATVVLQLVGEGRLGLDDPVDRHLPGLLTTPGHEEITVRMLLNHTAGLFEYTDDPRFEVTEADIPRWLTVDRWRHHSPRRLVRIGLSHPPYFRPGEGFHYSNTHYVLAGLLIEEITGRSYEDEITDRILRPLGLRHTSLPGDRPTLPGPHARAYLRLSTGPVDVTEFNPTYYGASGAVVSTAADLDRFHAALLGGDVLRPAELAEMKRLVDTGGGEQAFGLGLFRLSSPCGPLWGHSGGAVSFGTLLLGSPDGRRQVTVSYNAYDPDADEALEEAVVAFVFKALCGSDG
ncbi:hypothetical protein SGFS_005100 [Streptomyces graminofaciens]|uniref:Beta-lactamase-related domain-containing protein n=1 Tax=Streptomyces graminofaciens TaxID=68212 RepID=A0ABN5V7N3_9ACTN|nr:serine hydrolase domain-containing protein [Streptomyces graminofaciens]BBC29219.1 hypothetical protein SGFS_005100 [Streptomyces graminofaciens]